jgi:hypothetical protein
MLEPAKIKTVMAALAAFLEITFVRADQNGNRPQAHFFSYKIIANGQQPAYRNSVMREPVEGDDTKVLVKEENLSKGTVSLTFFGDPSKYDTIMAIAQAAADWFDSEEGKSACISAGVLPIADEREVQDRTAILETGYESRLGFDVRFNGRRVTSGTEDAVDISETIKSLEEVPV